ncbi:MAG: hypothetical protein AVO34_13545 [Firmicutes bacterium ML8_F2]|jgi:hypothetical protein|nr:MAG: hypothetical protein AVO34_13545 [Firmicutes bacterium ML8_F2]
MIYGWITAPPKAGAVEIMEQTAAILEAINIKGRIKVLDMTGHPDAGDDLVYLFAGEDTEEKEAEEYVCTLYQPLEHQAVCMHCWTPLGNRLQGDCPKCN